MAPVPRALAPLVLAVVVAATVTTAADAAERVLRIALNTDIRGTNPGVNRDANTDAVLHHVVESLVAYGEDLEIEPVLASAWEVRDAGRTWVFTLREGLLFHNGRPVTSREVRWSFERYLDPATRWQCRSWFVAGEGADDGSPSVIEAIETPDERTVIFRLAEPSTLFLDRLANVQCVPAVLHPESVAADGRWLAPVGTGPWRLAEWRPGEYADLVRFEEYRPRGDGVDGLAGRKEAHAHRLRFLVSPDPAATKAALLAGHIDIFHSIPMTAIEDFRNAATTVVVQSPTLSWSALLLQTRDPLLSDVRIRRAIAHAVDRRMIVDFNTNGYASVNSSAVPVSASAHTAVHDEWYAPDVEAARELLRQAGYDGEPVRIQANRKYDNMYANAVVIQAMLHAAGMNAHIDVMDWAAQLANYYSGNFQLSSFSFTAQATPLLRYLKLIGNKDERPVYLWEQPEAQALLSRAIATFDGDEKRRLYEELHLLMKDHVPIIGLYNANYAAAVGRDIEGYTPWPLMIPRLWGVRKASWD